MDCVDRMLIWVVRYPNTVIKNRVWDLGTNIHRASSHTQKYAAKGIPG